MYRFVVETHFKYDVNQGPFPKYEIAALNSACCSLGGTFGTSTIRPACSSIHLKSSKKVDPVICDEREFILDDSIGQFPVRLATQTEVIGVGCFESGAMSDSDQRLMQAFVDQEPHPRVSLSEISRHGASCQAWRGGRPLRGYA